MSLGQLAEEMYFEQHEPICEKCGRLLEFDEWLCGGVCFECLGLYETTES